MHKLLTAIYYAISSWANRKAMKHNKYSLRQCNVCGEWFSPDPNHPNSPRPHPHKERNSC